MNQPKTNITTMGIDIPTMYDGEIINHISELPLFQEYSVEELRYFDYVHEGYIIKPQRSPLFQIPQSTAPQNISYQAVSPWSFNFPPLHQVGVPQFSNPYGTLPTPSFQYNEIPDDDFDCQPFIPAEPNRYNTNPSIFSPFNSNLNS